MSSSPADSPADVGSDRPVQMPPSAGPLNSPAYGDTGVPGMAPGTPPAPFAGYSSGLSALEVIRTSLFDDIYSPETQARWTPLPLGTFFTEGWDQPFALPPAGSGARTRIGWINAFGGVFFRAWFFELFTPVNALAA